MHVARRSLLLTLLSLVTAARAQEQGQAQRFELRSLIGQVLDPAGEPIDGAAVTVSWRPDGLVTLEQAQSVTVKSPRRGYFAAKVPVGVELLAWFTGPVDEAGKGWISKPVACTATVERFELHADSRSQPKTVRIEGLEPWRESGPFTVELRPAAGVGPTQRVPVTDEDTFALPLLPKHACTTVILDKDDQPLGFYHSASRSTCTVPPPRTIPVLVEDAAGAPVKDAAVYWRAGTVWSPNLHLIEGPPLSFWRRIGTTDDKGKLAARLPLPQDPFEKPNHDVIMLASKAGFADCHSGWDNRMFVEGMRLEEADAEKQKTLRFVMREPQVVTGKLSLPGMSAPRRLAVSWTSKIAENNGWTHLPRTQVVPVDEGGTFELAAMPSDAYEIQFSCGAIQAQNGDGSTRWLPAALRPLGDLKAGPFDPTDGGLVPVAVAVHLADGLPATQARVIAIPADANNVDITEAGNVLALDHMGHGALLLPKGKWALVAVSRDGYAFAEAPEHGSADEAVDLVIEPWDIMRGVVTDADGQPVAGARISMNGSSMRGMGRVNLESRVKGALASLAARHYCTATTDAAGHFELRFLDMPGRTYRAQASDGSKRSSQFTISVHDDPLEIVIE